MWRSRYFTIFCTLSVALPASMNASAESEFQYFSNPDLDFWNTPSVKTAPAVLSKSENKAATTFPWKKYMDPKNDEFFREGDYTPPAPFMEIARNPSDENIANWFRYLELKNSITHRLQEKLETYTAARGAARPDSEVRPVADTKPPSVPVIAPDAKAFRLRLYFDSKCPHCQHMLGTMKELAGLGFWIDLRQIDADVSVRGQIPFPVTSATRQELKQYGIESVPLLLIGDLKQGTFKKIQGYQPTETILQTLRNPSPQTKGGQS